MAGQDWPHTRWEYSFTDVWHSNDDWTQRVQETLTASGLNGWEAWSMEGLTGLDNNQRRHGIRIYYKRPLQD